MVGASRGDGRRGPPPGEKEAAMRAFRLIGAAPGFFVSSWIVMLIVGAVHADVGIRAFGYTTSMVVTITLWLALVPAVGALAPRRHH
jgi:hypothetical protein